MNYGIVLVYAILENMYAAVLKTWFENFETFWIPKKPYTTNMNISRGSGQ